MHVDNPMYEAAATPALSLEPNVKGKLVDVPDSEYEEAIGVARNRHVFIESTKGSDCTSGGNSADGGGSSGSSTPASGIVFAIPMDEEYLEVLGNDDAAPGNVVAAVAPQADGNAGAITSMRSITLQGFSVPMEDEDENQDADCVANVANNGGAGNAVVDDDDGALPPLVCAKQGMPNPAEAEAEAEDGAVPPLPRKQRDITSTRARAESSC